MHYKQPILELFNIHDVAEDHLITNEILAGQIKKVEDTSS
jgi:hypothetical protein